MRTIINIIGIKHWEKDDKKHSKTLALLDDGTEAYGYGSDYKLGDEVEVFFHWQEIKMRKSKKSHR